MNKLLQSLLLSMFSALAVGCASEKLPAYTFKDEPTALADLAARGVAVKTLSGQATVTLRKPAGDTVHFDAAMAAELPQRFRIRAWKFGQAIFDLTITPEGVWLVHDSKVKSDLLWPAGLTPDRFAWGWKTISGQNLGEAQATAHAENHLLTLVQPLENKATLTSEIDLRTLTAREHRLTTAEGSQPFQLKQENYTLASGITWPRRIVATSNRGTITVEFRELEINQPLLSGTFTPPRRAEKLQ